jgi:hypothetical protein
VLEAYYEPQFRGNSYGFRPRRGCHTALMEITRNWTGTNWFIEGDIKGCFDNIHHAKLLEVIGRNIKDGTFLRLLKEMLKAGYVTYIIPTGEPDAWKLACPVRRGLVGKVLMNLSNSLACYPTGKAGEKIRWYFFGFELRPPFSPGEAYR